MSRIFISHASADNAPALALANWLDANGWSDYFLDIDDHRGIHPGERWMAALAGAVDRCEAVIFLVSPAWRDSKFCFAEFFEAKKLGKRIFGVIVSPIALSQLPEQMTAEWQVCDLTSALDPLPFTVSRLPSVPPTVLSFPRAGLAALARGLQKAGLDASSFVWPPDGESGRSPYPGLRALEEVDAAVFFGREAAIVRAIDQMRLVRERDVEQVFVVLGASGAGKSSFLRAGLLPRLRRDSEHFTVLPPIRPERAAISGSQGLLNSLKGALATVGQVSSPAQVRAELAATGLAGVLGRIALALQQASRSQGAAEPTLIVPIDQAEELFASDGQEEARQFLAHVGSVRTAVSPAEPSAGGGPRLRALFVLTMRSDSLPRLQAQARLQALSPVLFSLPAMPVSEFKAVIEGPAQRHTRAVKPLVIAPRLTEQLVVDAQGADALPLLALTLEWLYREFTDAQGTHVGYGEYQRLGGVRGVIGMAVERAFERPGSEPAIPALKAEQERLLQQTFPYIATVDPDTGEWKRRVALRDALRSKLPQADALVSRLIEQRLLLADSRRLADGAEPVEVVEVAHEALLRQWDTLERWLREFGAALSAAETIRRAANEWHSNQRDEALLVHTAHRLQAAEALLSDGRLEGRFEAVDAAYVAACGARDRRDLQAREEQLRRIAEQQAARAALQRRALWSLSAAALFVLGLALWIVMQTREVGLQTSLVLTGAAEVAADQQQFAQSLRLGVLAARASWLRPAHATAAAVLSRAAEASTLHTLFLAHTEAVWSASFSPDGKRVVTAAADKTARIWDADTGLAVGEPLRHGAAYSQSQGKDDQAVRSASFSPDSQRVVTASDDFTARMWNAQTGQPIGEPMKHADQVNAASFSPDGLRVVTASDDGFARLWDAKTGQPVGEPMKHGDVVYTASFNFDGTRVVTASRDQTARVWDGKTGGPVGEPLAHNAAVLSAAFSADGTRVVTASTNFQAQVWDALTSQPVGQPMLHAAEVYDASFSPDGKFVATASRDKTARLWHVGPDMAWATMAHTAPVVSARFSPDGLRVVTASDDGTARVWDNFGNPVGPPMMHRQAVNSARFSPDGQRVVTASDDRTAAVWEADPGRPLTESAGGDIERASASFSPDGRRLVTASWKAARIWDAATGKPVGVPMADADWVRFAAFSPDGKWVVTASDDTTARVWSADTGQPATAPLTHPYQVSLAAFSPDSRRVLTVLGGEAQVWDVGTGQPVGERLTHRERIGSASFSPDGQRVVTSSVDGTARVWNAQTGKAVGVPMTHGAAYGSAADSTSAEVHTARFSPDGKWVVTAADDFTARVWDAQTGQPVSPPMKHGNQVISAVFSPDGERVLTLSRDKTARVWQARSGQPVGEPMVHGERLTSARFSPDGQWVLTASKDKTARVWHAATGKPVGEPMTHANEVTDASFSADGRRVLTLSSEMARVWHAATGKPMGEAMARGAPMLAASFAADGMRVLTVSSANTVRLWSARWSSIAEPRQLIDEVCRHTLRGNVRHITEADVRAARILAPDRVGEDVCDGAP